MARQRLKIEDVDQDGKPVPEEPQQITLLPHDSIRPANGNRSNVNQEKLEELAQGIADVGLIHSLLVRPTDDGQHEIVSGERRWLAWPMAVAKRAELNRKRAQAGEPALPVLDAVPCVVRAMSDELAIQTRCVENAQREDVTPLDEARAYRALVQLGHRQAGVASMVGRTRAHVCERLSLLRLCPEAVEMLDDGRLPVTHAVLLSMLPRHESQQDAIRTLLSGKPPSAKALQHALQDRYYCRVGVAFSVKDKKLWPKLGACVDCPKLSGNCREELPDIGGDNVCTDPPCYHQKLKLASGARIQQAHARGVEMLPAAALDGHLKGNKLKPDAPYVDIKTPIPGDSARRTWEKAARQASRKLGETPKVMASILPSGRMMTVADKTQMLEALARLDGDKKPRASAGNEGTAGKAGNGAAESVCRDVVLAVAKRAGEHGLPQMLLRLVAEAMVDAGLDTDGARGLVLAFAKCKAEQDLPTAIGRLGVTELQSAIAVLACEFAGAFEAPETGELPRIVQVLAGQLRMDTDEMMREATGQASEE